MSIVFSSSVSRVTNSNFLVTSSCAGQSCASRGSPINFQCTGAQCKAELALRPFWKLNFGLRKKFRKHGFWMYGRTASLLEAVCPGYSDFKVTCGQDGSTVVSWGHHPAFSEYHFTKIGAAPENGSPEVTLSVANDLNGRW